MTERISSSSSDRVCRSPEDERSEEVDNDTLASTSMSRDPLMSAKPLDWESLPTTCDANAADIARSIRDGSATKSAGASGNAARTSERNLTAGSYASAGRTHDGGSAYAGVAALKGRTDEGIEGEALGASVQIGYQNELQATFARLGYSSTNVSGTAEALTANAHLGTDNADGSIGLNAGAVAALASGEATIKHSGWSITAGLAAGIGLEAHFGVRDDDHDGNPEFCGRLAVGVGIGGACIELPLIIRE